jgi:hypothetical protein
MANEHSWFADSATLTVSDTSGTNPTTVAVLKGCEFTPRFEIVELYGMESIKRRAVAKHSLKVDVSVKYAMWDPASDYIMWSVLNGSFSTTATTGVNDSAGSRNKCALFKIVATVKDTESLTHTITITATDVYFDSVPFALTEHEYIVRDMKGTAGDITIAYS